MLLPETGSFGEDTFITGMSDGVERLVETGCCASGYFPEITEGAGRRKFPRNFFIGLGQREVEGAILEDV